MACSPTLPDLTEGVTWNFWLTVPRGDSNLSSREIGYQPSNDSFYLARSTPGTTVATRTDQIIRVDKTTKTITVAYAPGIASSFHVAGSPGSNGEMFFADAALGVYSIDTSDVTTFYSSTAPGASQTIVGLQVRADGKIVWLLRDVAANLLSGYVLDPALNTSTLLWSDSAVTSSAQSPGIRTCDDHVYYTYGPSGPSLRSAMRDASYTSVFSVTPSFSTGLPSTTIEDELGLAIILNLGYGSNTINVLKVKDDLSGAFENGTLDFWIQTTQALTGFQAGGIVQVGASGGPGGVADLYLRVRRTLAGSDRIYNLPLDVPEETARFIVGSLNSTGSSFQ